jgi:hypothetical protein
MINKNFIIFESNLTKVLTGNPMGAPSFNLLKVPKHGLCRPIDLKSCLNVFLHCFLLKISHFQSFPLKIKIFQKIPKSYVGPCFLHHGTPRGGKINFQHQPISYIGLGSKFSNVLKVALMMSDDP